jgi:hypothetical protein
LQFPNPTFSGSNVSRLQAAGCIQTQEDQKLKKNMDIMLWMSTTNFVGPLGYVAGPSTFYPMVSPYWNSFLTFSLMRDSTSRLQAEHMLGKGNCQAVSLVQPDVITNPVAAPPD